MFSHDLSPAPTILTNVSPTTGASDHGARSTKQDIKQWVVDLGALASILDQDEILLNGGEIHADALKNRA